MYKFMPKQTKASKRLVALTTGTSYLLNNRCAHRDRVNTKFTDQREEHNSHTIYIIRFIQLATSDTHIDNRNLEIKINENYSEIKEREDDFHNWIKTIDEQL